MQKVHVTMLVYAPDHVSNMYEEMERSIEVGLRMVGEGFYLMKVLKAKVQHTIPRAVTAEDTSWKSRLRTKLDFGVKDGRDITDEISDEDMDAIKRSLAQAVEGDFVPTVTWGGEMVAEKSGEKLLEGGMLCNCGQCGRMHASGCAVHNEPAFPKGQCNCEDNDE